jgi:hypothetical protein
MTVAEARCARCRLFERIIGPLDDGRALRCLLMTAVSYETRLTPSARRRVCGYGWALRAACIELALFRMHSWRVEVGRCGYRVRNRARDPVVAF